MRVEADVVPNSPCGLCGRKATLKSNCEIAQFRSCVRVVLVAVAVVVVVVGWTSWAHPVPGSPYGLCGRKAALKKTNVK